MSQLMMSTLTILCPPKQATKCQWIGSRALMEQYFVDSLHPRLDTQTLKSTLQVVLAIYETARTEHLVKPESIT